MEQAQHAILRFLKHKGPAIGQIEAHDERTKEEYASNPDIDRSRSKYNFHIVEPQGKYRKSVEQQIRESGCRTRTDSVRMVEALITASPGFFKGKKKAEIREYFEFALQFIEKHQSKKTIISAVVHMDEKTPHMHLCFVPLTEDGRLCAKEIIGNKKKLTWWQDEFWKHMVKRYPDLERGESASLTGRDHIPTRLFKEAVHLNQQRDKLMQLLSEITPFTAGKKTAEIEAILSTYIPGVEKMKTRLKKFDGAYRQLKAENEQLEKKLDAASKKSVKEQMDIAQRLSDYEALRRTVESIPPEVMALYTRMSKQSKKEVDRNSVQ